MLRLPHPLAAFLLAFGIASPSSALLLDFYEGLDHGAIAVDGFADFGAYTVDVVNANRAFDFGVTFDSDHNGTTDPDIEFGRGWSGGNLADDRLGDILILQENSVGCGDGVCDDPDDEGGFPIAGTWRFQLDQLFTTFSIDVVDLGDHAVPESGFIRFSNGGVTTGFYIIEELAALFPDQNIEFGQDTANRIFFDQSRTGGPFDSIEILISGSGAIDNLIVEGATNVPEPSTAALFGLGLIALAVRRGRRR
jgi:hypothetical protein